MRKSVFKDLLIRAVQHDSSALAQLAMEPALTTANISHVLLGLAGDPLSFEMGYGCRQEDFFREIGAMYADLKKATGHERLRGFLGFLRFTMIGLRVAVRPASQEAPVRAIGEMQDLLADGQVREVFHALYKPSGQPEAASYWKGLDLDSLEVHRVGTTSVILKCRVASLGGEARALKCLLFPYSQVPGIAGATRQYAEDYPSGKVPCTVHIYASTDKWILMDFAAGPTLAEFLSQERQRAGRAGGSRGLDGSSVAAIRADLLASVGPQLLDAAQQLHAAGFEHRDLTPSNIIVVTKPDIRQPDGKVQRGAIERLVLIDLGRNYLFTRQADVPESREARFVAPEVKDDKPAASSDIYSLGMILAEVADPEGTLDGVIPDSLYQYAPHMARFIEDLIDASPDNRLLIFGQGTGPDLYDGLRAIFADLLKLLIADKPALIKPGRTRQFLELFLPSSRQVSHRLLIWRETRSAHPAIGHYSGYLLGWSVACTAAWYVIFTVAVLWGLRDVGVDATPTTLTAAEHLTRSGSWLPAVPDWRFSLQSALLGFSIGMAGARYYQNIFAGLTTRSLGGRRAFWTEVFLRGTSFCALPPILFGNIVEQRWWPWLCAIGFVWPTTTSFLSYTQARHCLKRARELSTVSASVDPSLEAYGQWWTSMAFMISGIVIIATCLQLGWAHDYWIFAVWFCLINVVQMYAIKCAYFAPAVRGALTRAFIAGERWQAFQRTRNGPATP
jgi:serine/threonine protein kinase